MGDSVQTGWEAVCERWAAGGYGALSGEERLWFNVRSLIDAVEGGGLMSYFYNSGADSYGDMLRALDRLEAGSVKAQVERVVQLFPGGVPGDVEGRNRVIDSWEDDDESVDRLLEEVDDALMPQMEELERRLDVFVRGFL